MTGKTIILNFILELRERYFSGESILTDRTQLVWDNSKIIAVVRVSDMGDLDEIDRLNNELKLKFRNVEILVVNLVENISPEKNDYKILSYSDFSITGKPDKSLSDYFSESNTDLIINLIADPGIFERHIIRSLPARYKVGRKGGDLLDIYDIIIDSNSDNKLEIVSQAKHYINNLNINR